MLIALNRTIAELNMLWKQIAEFPNYQVSDTGLVRNKAGKTLKTFVQSGGYEVATLSSDSLKSAKRTVHRLVALAYLENPDKLPEVNHKDGNKLNNRLDNLEWCSGKQNMKHAKETGIWKYNKPTEGKKLKPRGTEGGSKFFGVCKPSGRNYWFVRVQNNGKVVFQKCFPTELEAAKYYDKMVKHHKLNRPLNFPEH